MSMWVFLKVFADASLCFAVLAGFPTLFTFQYSLLWPALLCAAGAGIGALFCDIGKDPLRFLGLLLSAAVLLIPDNTRETVILLPVVLYSAAVVFRGALSLEYYTFRQYFKRTLIFLLGFFLALCALAYLDKPFDSVENFDGEAVLSYGVFHAIAGIMLLRQLRLGEQGRSGRLMNAKQSVIVLGGTAAVVLAIAAMEKWLHQSLMSLLRTVFTSLFAPLLMIYNWFAGKGMDIVEGLTGKDPMQPQQRPTTPPGTIPVGSVPPDTAVPEEPERAFPWLVLVVLAIAVVLLIIMLRTFRSRSKAPVKEEITEKLQPKQRQKRNGKGSNRSRVRRIYRDFLKSQRKQGLKLRRHHTSADVQQRLSADTDDAAAEQLRQIYLAARYDETGEITARQLSDAKLAYKNSNKK